MRGVIKIGSDGLDGCHVYGGSKYQVVILGTIHFKGNYLDGAIAQQS